MQTSGNGSDSTTPAAGRFTRAAGVALMAGLGFLATSAWVSCSPGSLDCAKFDCPDGTGGAGGSAATGGGGGMGGSGPPPIPAACGTLMIANVNDVETKLIASRCGTGPMGATCHSNTFPPTGLHMPAMIRTKLVDKKSTLCKDDFLINKANPAKSFVLAKVKGTGSTMFKEVDCPTNPSPMTQSAKMPYRGPPMPAEPFSPAEIECFEWYVNAVAGM